MRLLLVEDNRDVARWLAEILRGSRYTVDVAHDGAEEEDFLRVAGYALMILDLALPRVDGLAVLRGLRGRRDTMPVIVLTADASLKARIAGLDEGADDYLTKPFSMPELQARVRAHLRRVPAAPDDQDEALVVGDLAIDTAAHLVTLRGEPLHLTPKEFDLLRLLLRNAGRVMTHKVLLRSIWGPHAESQPENLRVLVGQLRKKLDTGTGARYIQSEPWVGYRLVPTGTSTPD